MVTSGAERQRRYRERRAAGEPARQFTTVPVVGRRRTRPQRWTAAVEELRLLQGEYDAWRERLPESLAESRTAELLEIVTEVDLDVLDVELPRGFGRD
jgi:hypothetical protein